VTKADWEFAKTLLVILSALVLWFLGPIVRGLVGVWRVWNGKDSIKTRTSKHETLL
jgi:hypothetical protein